MKGEMVDQQEQKAELILRNTFKRIRRSSLFRNTGLKNACNESLEQLRKEGRHDASQEEKYWTVLDMSLESNSPDTIGAALEGIVTLLESKLLKVVEYDVERESSSSSGNIFLTNKNLVEDICNAIDNLSAIGSEGAFAMAKRFGIKALMACVVNEEISVHSLLLTRILSLLLKLGVSSKSLSADEPFITAMKEVVSIVFFRMEAKMVQLLDTKKKKEEESASSSRVVGRSGEEIDKEGGGGEETRALGDGDEEGSERMDIMMSMDSVSNMSMNILADVDQSEEVQSQLSIEIEHVDALCCLRKLISIDSTEDTMSSIIKMKVLLGLVQNSVSALKATPKFVSTIKGDLCDALRIHLTSSGSSTLLISYALRVFVALARQMKVILKPEVQVFISSIFLRVLDNSHEVVEHKLLVLGLLCDLCQDPVSLVEIFVNYDCDLGADNLLRCIVTSIARVAKQYSPAVGAGRPPVTEEGKLKLREMAVRGLVFILQSLICAGHLGEVPGSSFLNELPGFSLGRDGSKPPLHHPSPSLSSHTSLDGEKERKKCSGGGSEGGGESDSPEKGSPQPRPPFTKRASLSAMSNFEIKMKRQEELELGIVKFNINPTAGIEWLAAHGLLSLDDAKSVSNFFLNHSEQLNKMNIGEYLGHNVGYSEGFNASVLRAYAEAMDFNGLSFVDSIRHFISGFQLPGEAQKIDRIMEMFTERFCICNPDEFSSADVAFILAYSIIMLNTDLHSLAIKDEKRMSKSDFIENNRRVSRDACDEPLSLEFLGGIYDEIKCTPIALNDGEALHVRNSSGPIRSAFSANRSRSRIKQALNEEKNDTLKASGKDFTSVSNKQLSGDIFADSLDYSPSSQSDGGEEYNVGLSTMTAVASGNSNSSSSQLFVDMVRIFEVVWGPVVGVFAHVFEMAYSLPLVKLSTFGCTLGVRISSALGLNTALETFINTITQFATLRGGSSSPTVEISSFNIICFQALLTICQLDGGRLGTSWYPILQCMTQFRKQQDLTSPEGSNKSTPSPSVQVDSSATVVVTDELILRTDSIKHTSAVATNDVGGMLSSSNLPFEGHSSVDVVGDGPTVFLNNQISYSRDETSSSPNCDKEIVTSGKSLRVDDATHQPSSTSTVVKSNPKPTPNNSSSTSDLSLKSKILALNIEEIFAESLNFSCNSLKHLIDGLIAIGGNGKDPAGTTHCLRWLVQVADINMDFRSRLEWQLLWASIGGYLSVLGSQDGEPQIPILALGYLKQLALKFLAKPELWDFHFQRNFLGPFEAAVARSPHVPVREFALECVEQLVTREALCLRSGWAAVFSVIASASQDTSPGIVNMAYSILDSIVKNCLDLVIEADISSVVLCFSLFISAESLGVVLGSIEDLQVCGRLLSLGSVDTLKQRPARPSTVSKNVLPDILRTAPPSTPHRSSSQNDNGRAAISDDDLMVRNEEEVSSSQPPQMEEEEDVIVTTCQLSERNVIDDQLENRSDDVDISAVKEKDELSKLHEDPSLHLWWCILEGLARSAGDERFEVRKIGISTIQNVLREVTHPEIEDTPFWSLVFTRILFPTMKNVVYDVSGAAFLSSSSLMTGDNHFPINSNSWIATTVPEIFALIVDIYVDLPSVSRKQCLPCIIEFFSWYVCNQDAEIMAVFAIRALHKLVDKLASNELSTSNLRTTNEVCLGGSFGADKSDCLESTSDEQNNCCHPPITNHHQILDDLCISISNMLLNSLLPTVGSFRIGKSNLVRSTSELSKNEPDEIGTFPSEEHDNEDDGTGVEEMEKTKLRKIMTKFVATLHVQTLGFYMLAKYFTHLQSTSITHLLSSMRTSYLYGRSVNENFNLRSWLHCGGFGEEQWKGGILPNLFKRDMDGELLYIGALFMIIGMSVVPAGQYDEGVEKEKKGCHSFFLAGDVEGGGDGSPSSSGYHYPTPNISMKKWVTTPDGRVCQKTAYLLLHEMADELINRYLHVENATLSDWTREVKMEMQRTIETEDAIRVNDEHLKGCSLIDWSAEKVELSRQLSLSTEYLLQGLLNILISKQEPTTTPMANDREKDGMVTNTAAEDVKLQMMEWLYPHLIELIAVSQLPVRLCVRDILKFSSKRIYSLE